VLYLIIRIFALHFGGRRPRQQWIWKDMRGYVKRILKVSTMSPEDKMLNGRTS
jgi:hypothetical protein